MATVLSPEVVAFRTPRTLAEAYATLDELGSDARVVAGGTDVMVQLLGGQISPSCLLHIGRIDGLDRVGSEHGRVHIGCLVSHRTVVQSHEVSTALPALAEASATVGGWQTQEAGTVAGNICNASPAADTVPPLLTGDATIHLRSSTGERRIPLPEFIVGRRATAARPDELVVGIDVEACRPGTGEVYLKTAPRTAMEVAVVGLSVRLSFEEDVLVDARVAAGAVAPVPARVPEVEATLVESGLTDAGVADAAAMLSNSIDPIDDNRSTASYRRKVIARMLGHAVEIARTRAQEH